MNQCGVYEIRCEPTGEEYVGASVHIVKRIREHFYRLEKGVHRNRRLQHAYNEYGKDSFRSEVLLYCDPSNLEMYGNRLIEKFQPELNIVHTEHTKGKKIRAMNRSAKAILKILDVRFRIIKKFEKIQKRTHRL